MHKILIIGSLPPPIGGVTIHVKRLLNFLDRNNVDYYFFNLRNTKLKERFFEVSKYKIIHLHSSNVYLRFSLAAICFLTRKKLIITFHGNLNRYGVFKNLLDRLSIKLIKYPIILNNESYKIAQKLNAQSKLFTAFIPPNSIEALPVDVFNKIKDLQNTYTSLFCTNAYNVSYDKNLKEVYQISDMVALFNSYRGAALIISDPSSNYKKLLEQKYGMINDNILIIPFKHDFNAVIRECDCMIRYTTTDGDSISINEALYAKKKVIATDVVSRPNCVTVIENNNEALLQCIKNINLDKNECNELPNGAYQILSLYNSIK